MFKWTHPVHEILTPIKKYKNNIIDIPEIQLNHHADNTKSRSSYLPLLELSVKENPTDDRNTHYLGREYMFQGEYDKAIECYKKAAELEPSPKYTDNWLSIAQIFKILGNPSGAIHAYQQVLTILKNDYHLVEGKEVNNIKNEIAILSNPSL